MKEEVWGSFRKVKLCNLNFITQLFKDWMFKERLTSCIYMLRNTSTRPKLRWIQFVDSSRELENLHKHGFLLRYLRSSWVFLIQIFHHPQRLKNTQNIFLFEEQFNKSCRMKIMYVIW